MKVSDIFTIVGKDTVVTDKQKDAIVDFIEARLQLKMVYRIGPTKARIVTKLSMPRGVLTTDRTFERTLCYNDHEFPRVWYEDLETGAKGVIPSPQFLKWLGNEFTVEMRPVDQEAERKAQALADMGATTMAQHNQSGDMNPNAKEKPWTKPGAKTDPKGTNQKAE